MSASDRFQPMEAIGIAGLRETAKQVESQILEDRQRLLRKDPVRTVESLLRLSPSAREMKQQRVADAMHMSVSRLKSLLSKRGTSFMTIRDQVLKERCMIYIGQVSAADLADTLGYADPSHFYKAFERWTGRRYREFKQRQKTSLLRGRPVLTGAVAGLATGAGLAWVGSAGALDVATKAVTYGLAFALAAMLYPTGEGKGENKHGAQSESRFPIREGVRDYAVGLALVVGALAVVKGLFWLAGSLLP